MNLEQALHAAELSDGAARFALWLFAKFGGSGVCWLPQRELAALWRCSAKTIGRYLGELEASQGGLVCRVMHPRQRWQALLLFTGTAAGAAPIGHLAEPERVHRIRGEAWTSKALLQRAGRPERVGQESGAEASAEAPGESGRGTSSPTSSPHRSPHPWGDPSPVGGPGGGVPPRVGGGSPHRWGGHIEPTESSKQQRHVASLATEQEPEPASVGAAAAVSSRGEDAGSSTEVLRSLGLGPSDRGHREVLEALASGNGDPAGVAQHLHAAVAWAKTQRNPVAALVAAARGGYLLERVTRSAEPEKPRGIHDAPAPSASSSLWEHELESLVIDLENPDPWARKAALRVVRASHGGSEDRALEAFCEQVACVPDDAEPPCRHPGGIDHWRAWVDRRRETQRAAGAKGVACA